MNYQLRVLIASVILLSSCQSKGQQYEPPEDISIVFKEVRGDLSYIANIASEKEPGERLRITGIVYESDGKTPAKNVQMYFYHTDAKGIYAKKRQRAEGYLCMVAWI